MLQGQLPSARSAASSVLIGDRIFYYGGGDEQTAYYDDLHVLNISTCIYIRVCPPLIADVRQTRSSGPSWMPRVSCRANDVRIRVKR